MTNSPEPACRLPLLSGTRVPRRARLQEIAVLALALAIGAMDNLLPSLTSSPSTGSATASDIASARSALLKQG